MGVLKVHHESEFTVISNSVIRDKNLSLDAIGLLCSVLSLPSNWEFTETGLAKMSSDSISSVRKTLKELEKNGYLYRTPYKYNGKIRKREYFFYEDPKNNEHFIEVQ